MAEPRTLRGPDGSDDSTVTAPSVARGRAPHRSRADQVALGLQARQRVPRRTHAGWTPAPDRGDPVTILEAQATTRVPELVPIRYGRMMATPFTFYRGAAAVMAADLRSGPDTGLLVQLCGDAHLANFGVYASPERTLVFDLNDFDETLKGPFEWDVKRLAASLIVAGRSLGWSDALARRALVYTLRTYRLRMAEYAGLGSLATWYSRIAFDDLAAYLPKGGKAAIGALSRQAGRRDSLGALDKLTEVKDGTRRFRDEPPLLERLHDRSLDAQLHETFRAYRRTLAPERRRLLDHYRFVDLARKVVGVGSVGTRCWVAYLEGADDRDPLFLQVKEARPSVLEPARSRPTNTHQGQRVVVGQRLMQAASDVLLGWVTSFNGHHYYWRQLWDAKLSVDLETIREPGLLAYARACGWALARAHARSGDPIAIAAYLGSSDRFDASILDFAEGYAEQNERDHAALAAAVASGRIQATPGV